MRCSIAAALFLFVRALRVQTWTDVAAAVFALTVFTGLNTFRGLVREAFPINHCTWKSSCVVCWRSISRSRAAAVWTDAAAAVTFVVASLTVESGVLVWVVARRRVGVAACAA